MINNNIFLALRNILRENNIYTVYLWIILQLNTYTQYCDLFYPLRTITTANNSTGVTFAAATATTSSFECNIGLTTTAATTTAAKILTLLPEFRTRFDIARVGFCSTATTGVSCTHSIPFHAGDLESVYASKVENNNEILETYSTR